ncbi:hypothetical protein L211DRAFT_845879 [Terfezia boudieri ATCC MYA-4762]|uniref:Uncharacterized protein n=1 Tax=Terfezia boudieri ATCC MYA-4762 TaxID=1051890 RepID=A0A3N4M3E2_9PEZI|nr:hypothetical protein L211DRAFT_845879 [Terfezia boudieri ATCC MYA-4762]
MNYYFSIRKSTKPTREPTILTTNECLRVFGIEYLVLYISEIPLNPIYGNSIFNNCEGEQIMTRLFRACPLWGQINSLCVKSLPSFELDKSDRSIYSLWDNPAIFATMHAQPEAICGGQFTQRPRISDNHDNMLGDYTLGKESAKELRKGSQNELLTQVLTSAKHFAIPHILCLVRIVVIGILGIQSNLAIPNLVVPPPN